MARLIDFYGGQIDETGKINKMPNMDLIKKDIFSISISDKETIATIKEVYRKYGVILEPHGAVGFAGLKIFLSKENKSFLSISLETAHPAKFPEEIKKTLGIESELPKSLKGLEKKKERFENISSNYKDFQQFLKDKF